jgi:SAM-dependent methyltransferase
MQMDKKVIEWQGHVGHILDSINEYNIIECKKCQFKHAVPIPTEKELLNFYTNEFYSIEKPLFIERMTEDLDWWNLCYDDRYNFIEQQLPNDRRSILDIGSGPGFFLKRGQERGWDTLGVEPSHQAHEYSTKVLDLNVENGFFNSDMCGRLKDFDVIHMSEVLEHIPNPEDLLELVYNQLSSGGLLCIAVPNDYSPLQTAASRTLGHKSWWIGPPQHINYFNFTSLEKLLTNFGFTVLLKESTFPIDMFLLMGENYIDNEKVGRKCHGMVKEFEKRITETGDKSLKRKLYQKFAELNIGREVIIYVQK